MSVLMNNSRLMKTINFDTYDADGRRESAHIGPRQQMVVTEMQMASHEVQKLLGAKILIDVSAARARGAALA